jgi:glutaredoxin 3
MAATPHAKEYVQKKITTHKVVVFSKTYCPYCIKAKKALGTILKPDQMEVIELDQISGSPTCIQIQDALNEATGGRSVPRVFIGGNFIGGGDDTAAKQANGELAQLLQAVGLP